MRVSSRVLRIRDPIHGYVTVTAIEQPLLDHPITQRLRWVAQSGLAQFAFPEVRTSRFTHSLGTMHLASRFLLGILRNAEPLVNEEAKTSTLFGRLGRGKPPHEQIGYAMVSLILRSVYAPLTATELRDVVSPAFKQRQGSGRCGR